MSSDKRREIEVHCRQIKISLSLEVLRRLSPAIVAPGLRIPKLP
ncbi:MAG: hypothetical protein SFV54_19800 [Bryobacteraceae bacterium]|nr:hypothetical protein [Bryobacteraceae bacterium]